MNKKNIIGLTPDELINTFSSAGVNYSHAVAISNSIYKKGVTDFSLICRIPKKLQSRLTEEATIGVFQPIKSEVSADGSIKYLFRNPGGMLFETVYIPEGKRRTVCVSVQSGCRMGCPFCVTARYGFHGNLDAGDIINQILGLPYGEMTTHVVFMGMGEPLDNLENVLKTCEILTAEWGMAMSRRNITISTVGILPAIESFLESTDCNLALSLFSPFPGERIKVVPAEKKYPAVSLIEIMRTYPVRKRRRLSIAYVMIEGLNDTDSHLTVLKELLKGSGIRVNLLRYHRIPGDVNIASGEERMKYFKHSLIMSGISASVRKSRGADISAACGLLASGLLPE